MVAIDGVFLAIGDQAPRLLDTAAGEVSRLALPSGYGLQNVSFSDWIDEDKQRQMAGLWVQYQGSHDSGLVAQFGLARLSFPSGHVLECVPDAPILNSPPCWYPGAQPRVLFAAMDGRLYQCTFSDGRSFDSQVTEVKLANGARAPRRLSDCFVTAPVWPKVPALGGRLIAEIADRPIRGHFTSSRLWWLRLTPDGAAIAEMGPLSVPETGYADDAWECLPSVTALPDGGCLLAYQRTTDFGKTRDLCVARVNIDTVTGEPTFRPSSARKIAAGVALLPAAFTPDAAWVYVVEGKPMLKSATVRRIPVDLDTLASHATTVRVP